MKNLNHTVTGLLFVALVLILTTTSAMAQDPVKVAPDQYKVLLENDQVRVLEVHIKPGQKAAMHAHPACVEYFFSDAKAKFMLDGGKSQTRELKAGLVAWSEPEKHASENTGTTEGHVLIVELKGGKSGKTEKGADPMKVDPKHFKVRLDNARVRVLEFTAKPHEKVPMHTHPDYVMYNFTSGKTTFSSADGKTGERESKAGSVVYRQSETHGATTGDGETHNLMVELKPPAKSTK